MKIASLEETAAQMGQISKLIRLLASSGVTSENLQLAIDNRSARVNLAEYIAMGFPKVDYKQLMPDQWKKITNFDEVDFFQNRPGLWVHSYLQLNVDLQTRVTRSAAELNRYVLENSANKAGMFGKPGSKQHAQTIKYAVDLGQIAELITKQEGGMPGILLNNSGINIFLVRGKADRLYVVRVYWCADGRHWRVYCNDLYTDFVWLAGIKVFSN